jgi:hypothetical protein
MEKMYLDKEITKFRSFLAIYGKSSQRRAVTSRRRKSLVLRELFQTESAEKTIFMAL